MFLVETISVGIRGRSQTVWLKNGQDRKERCGKPE